HEGLALRALVDHRHELPLRELVGGDRFREHDPFPRILERAVVAGARGAERAPRDPVARLREAGERTAHRARLRQPVLDRDAAAFEEELGGDRGAEAELPLHLARREPRAAALEDEPVHPFRAALAQLRPDYRDVGDAAVRDPALGAVKDVLVAFAAGGGAHAARVRAEVGLREPEAADGAAARQLRQPFATLVLRSEGEDGVHDETRLDAREGAKPAVAALELLVDETVGDVAEVCTAV